MLNLQPSTFTEFAEQTRHGNVVPVVGAIIGDLLTPVAAYMRLAAESRYSFLLESVQGGENVARYSFLGADPELALRARGGTLRLERLGRVETREVPDPFAFLRELFGKRRLAASAGLPPFAGGAVGFLAYEAARWFEPALSESHTGADDLFLMFCRTVLAFDHAHQRIHITHVVFTEEAGGDPALLRQLYENAVAEIRRIEEDLLRPAAVPSAASPKGDSSQEARSDWTRARFEAAVGEIQELIAAGECYQAVLSQRFHQPTSAGPLTIYRALRATNPSPYMYFLRMDDTSLVGASPEMLVRCRGGELEYRPIAGTRPRGRSAEEDAALSAELLADEKERAEHIMLVDLGRNDLGRVAQYGSVRVERLMDVERYSHVQHIVSSLRATLRDGLDRFDALAACFPAGTVTGAPKIRAMQAIRQLEPTPRGAYAGAVLYLDYAGNLDSCIAIRTMVLRGGIAQVQAGAGVVADSVPAREYEETVNKARALLRAIALAEQGL